MIEPASQAAPIETAIGTMCSVPFKMLNILGLIVRRLINIAHGVRLGEVPAERKLIA